IVALDENGTTLRHLAVPNTPEGVTRLHEFGATFFPHRWAVEGTGNHFIAAFVAQLLAQFRVCVLYPSEPHKSIPGSPGTQEKRCYRCRECRAGTIGEFTAAGLHAAEHQRELQELTRTQRRLSEQLKANRCALQELTAESSVREVLKPVIEI